MIYNNVNLLTFDTDKIHGHNYMPVYKIFFDNINCQNLLEIGVFRGESLRMFNAIFPDATIYGIDTDMNVPNIQFETDKIKVGVVDQTERVDIDNFLKKSNFPMFDIILDDGGHTQHQQQSSLGYLFKYVRSGGIYIVEDLHTWGLEWSYPDNKINVPISTLEILKTYQKTKKIQSPFMAPEEINYLNQNIHSVYIWSQTDSYAHSVTSVILKK